MGSPRSGGQSFQLSRLVIVVCFAKNGGGGNSKMLVKVSWYSNQ